MHFRDSADRLTSALSRLRSRLFAPVDAASLVYFRVVFGAIMLVTAWRYINSDKIYRYFLEPDYLFTYLGFDWVRPWPGEGLYIHFYLLALLSIFVMIGFMYRASATLLFLAFTYIFLLEQARYLNHYYLICLVSLLMIFLPAHRDLSVDARMRPSIRGDLAPAWCLWLLRIQIGLVYFYGGVAKINWDWLNGWPLRIWLASRTDRALIGPLLDEVWVALLFSYSGLLIDLLAFPLLLWKRTRVPIFLVLTLFHLTNSHLFDIGVFPWFSLASTLLFFPPDWPRRIFNWPLPATPVQPSVPPGRGGNLTLAILGLYLAIQILVPLRHLAYPGNVSWTEEGHRFSWHMKLRDKEADSTFRLRDLDTGETWEVDPEEELTRRQYSKMSSRPYMTLAYAHYLADRERREGRRVEIKADVWASLNGRESERLIDPDTNLATQPRTLFAATPWILPLGVSESERD